MRNPFFHAKKYRPLWETSPSGPSYEYLLVVTQLLMGFSLVTLTSSGSIARTYTLLEELLLLLRRVGKDVGVCFNRPSPNLAGLTWIVERSFAWLGRNRRLSKDYRSG
jgi:hypothetical protein